MSYPSGFIGDNKYKRDWLKERTETWESKQNDRETSPGNLRHGGMFNTIGVDIFTMIHGQYGICLRRSGEDSLGNIFAATCLRKVKISFTHLRNSKYNDGQ